MEMQIKFKFPLNSINSINFQKLMEEMEIYAVNWFIMEAKIIFTSMTVLAWTLPDPYPDHKHITTLNPT